MSPKKFKLKERLEKSLPELMIFIRSRELNMENTEKITSAVIKRAYQEINASIGDNYFYTWLTEIAKSEILSSLLPPADTVHSFVCPSVELVVKMRRDNASNKTRGYC